MCDGVAMVCLASGLSFQFNHASRTVVDWASAKSTCRSCECHSSAQVTIVGVCQGWVTRESWRGHPSQCTIEVATMQDRPQSSNWSPRQPWATQVDALQKCVGQFACAETWWLQTSCTQCGSLQALTPDGVDGKPIWKTWTACVC